MKKVSLVLLIIATVLLTVACDEVNNDTKYINEKYGFSFNIPDNWKNKYETMEYNGGSVTFIYSECLNEDWDKQIFFTINTISTSDYEEWLKETNPPVLLEQKGDKSYVLVYPLDIGNLNEKQIEEYKALLLDEEEVKKRFSLDN